MSEYDIKAREIVIKMQFQDQPLMFDQAVKCALVYINGIIAHHEAMFDMGFKDVHIAMSSPIKTYIDIMNPMLDELKGIKLAIEKL